MWCSFLFLGRDAEVLVKLPRHAGSLEPCVDDRLKLFLPETRQSTPAMSDFSGQLGARDLPTTPLNWDLDSRFPPSQIEE
jgi:hypothetical protein